MKFGKRTLAALISVTMLFGSSNAVLAEDNIPKKAEVTVETEVEPAEDEISTTPFITPANEATQKDLEDTSSDEDIPDSMASEAEDSDVATDSVLDENSEENSEGESTLEATPEVTLEAETTPEVTIEPTPEVEATPEVTPEAGESDAEVTPEVTPEITSEPESTPEATPEATPEVESTPEATPEVESTPEATPIVEVTPEIFNGETDYVKAFVNRLYVNMMGREADEDGINYWMDALKSNTMSGNEVANSFYVSPEFVEISGKVSDEAFMKIMYATILGRVPDEDGLKYWVDLLENKELTRDELFGYFLTSEEWNGICEENGISREGFNVSGFVNRLYYTVFDRAVDEAGKAYWVDELVSGRITAINAAYGFFFSEEYGLDAKSDVKFITDLYTTLMGRDYDEAGLKFWLDELNSKSRLAVYNLFAISPEFTGICERFKVLRGDPILEKKNLTVCIDPGHSKVMPAGTCPMGPGSSVGKPADAVGTHGSASGLMEYELTLSIGMQLKDELEARGYDVIMTRTDGDKAYDLVYRAEVANDNADIMVRIHADGLDNTSITGCSAIIITPNNPWNPQTYAGSRKLADSLITNYIAQTGIRNRGVVQEDTMAGNNWSTVPCVLFELGFMTNPTEDLKMADPSFQKQMVAGLADGVDQYFE